MKEFKHELNGVVFSVVWDKKTILETIQEERKGFIENHFVSTYSDEDDGCLSKEVYEENLDDMLQMFEVISSEDSLISLIEMAKKKKDGSFHKNRVTYIYQCESSVYITNWHNIWIYHALKVSPIDDYTLLLECLKITDTPG